ncbi:MAG TPA: D-2-hydroxyacid dehydrogenase [Acidimicrobiales bacterium]|nr:D-2-hydroxyacid dehydrogenase [Acidimicrobiales bacterium]
MSDTLTVCICSYLEDGHAAAIAGAPGVEVLYAPELLPVPRYVSDHHGAARHLDDAGLQRWREMLAQAEVCFDFDWQDPAGLPARAPRLRWIQATSAGIGGFMARTGLDASTIVVTTAAGVHATALTEWVLTGVLHFVKDVPDLQRRQAGHRWERLTIGALAGRRAVVVGLGQVGSHVATVLASLGVEVWGAGRPGASYDIPAQSRLGTTAEVDALLPGCDILVLCAPLTGETEGLIGPAQLALLPERAILVNIARGQLVDEEALIGALSRHEIGAAVLDVARSEPLPPDSPLWDLDNVLICPHSASTFATENGALVELFLDNLSRFRRGEALRNLYRPERGY